MELVKRQRGSRDACDAEWRAPLRKQPARLPHESIMNFTSLHLYHLTLT